NRRQWFPRVTAHFSDALTPPRLEHVSTARGRAFLTNWLRDQMVSQQFGIEMELGPRAVLDAVVESARRRPRSVVLEDLTRQGLTGRDLLVGVELMARQWRSVLGGAAQERIGIILPNVSATPVALFSLWAADKVPAILNY